jgi:hypothetical protein
MDDADVDTAEELFERGRVLRVQAEELFRVAAIIREQAQKLTDQAEKSARILAAKKADRVKQERPARVPDECNGS